MDFHNAILCCRFLCTLLISSHYTATTPRATTPHPFHHGLSRLCMHPGYHAIVYIYSLVITPKLPRSTTHVHRVITPAIDSSLYFTFHRLLRHLFFSSTPPSGRHTYQPTPHATDSIERVGRALLSANEKNKNKTHLLRAPRRK